MSAIPAKRVSARTDAEGGLETWATFYMDGERVAAEWANESYRREVEQDGIRALIAGQLGRLRPCDGRAFYDAIEMAYWQSSRVVVTPAIIERG